MKKLLTLAIALAYLAYAAAYIQQTSFVINGERYYALFDDAMISMRYAQNLAAGNGPVWNVGERVEGYSNPLWVVYMAFWHLFPIPASKISLIIQISGALFIAATFFVLHKLSDEAFGTPYPGILASAMTAAYLPLHNWALQGMEVSLLTLLLTLMAWLTVRALNRRTFPRALYLLMGAATLVRIDMAVPFIVIAAFLWWFDPTHRRKHLQWALLTFAIFIGGQTALRLAYYGSLVPNTYLLKVTGVPAWFRIAAGGYVFFRFLWTTNWLLYLIPFIAFAFAPRRETLLLLTLFAAQCAYSIYVGGDAWEHRGGANRFIAQAMPLFFLALTAAADQLRQSLHTPKFAQPLASIAMLGLLTLSMFNFNTMIESNALERVLFIRQPLYVKGTKRYTQMGLFLNQITEPQARIAVVTAGAIPYFANRPAIDLMGKSDPIIAAGPMRIVPNRNNIANFRPGHTKWNYAYSIATLQPDIVAQLWDETTEEAAPYLTNYVKITVDDIPYYLRADSPYIHWDAVQPFIQK